MTPPLLRPRAQLALGAAVLATGVAETTAQGSDVVEGQAGEDQRAFRGSAGAEKPPSQTWA